MIFANTTYLWGMLGILIPIAIHLWSRKKVVTIKVGSIKLLQASEPKQTSSFKINELWLLLLRAVTIALLTLILSEPSISKTAPPVKINYIVEPSLVAEDQFKTILDTLPKNEVRLLIDGFPLVEDYENQDLDEVPQYWQLAQQMHVLAADSIVVFSKGYQKGIKGKRPSIQANTRWITLETTSEIKKAIVANAKPGYTELISIHSYGNRLRFEKDSVLLGSTGVSFNSHKDSLQLKVTDSEEWIPIKKNKPIRIGVIQNDTLVDQFKYLKAAYRAIATFLNRPLEIEFVAKLEMPSNQNFNTLVVLDGAAPETFKETVLMLKPDSLANELIEMGPAKNVFYITQLLNNENVVSGYLPEKLIALLNNDGTFSEYDNRIVSEKELQPIVTRKTKTIQKAKLFEMNPWLWGLLILVVVVERILAKHRKQ